MKLLVCGGRDYSDEQHVRAWLEWAKGALFVSEVIHGGARGADDLAGKVAESLGIPTRIFRADWDTHGRAAGMIRNRKMLEEGKPHFVMAFPGGVGTEGMIKIARDGGVTVIVVAGWSK